MSAIPFEYLIYAIIFVVVLLMVEGGYYLLVGSRKGEKAVNRRMQMLSAGGGAREVLESLRRQVNENPEGFFRTLPGLTYLETLVTQGGMVVSSKRILIFMASIAGGLMLLILVLLPAIPMVLAPLIAIPLGVFLPIFFFKFRKKRRMKLLSAQLPDALDLIVRSLRAGHPISSALSLVSREMKDPMGTEIGIVVDEMTYGLDFRAALENLRRRIPAPDLHYLVVTINIQHGTGGNLAEVLDNLSTVIRARYQMFAKIKALSAEGRISATILSVIPFFVLAAVWLTSPGYYKSVMGDPALPVIAGIAIAMELTAIGVMWKMVNFKV
jgi:tight adherence protein B